MVFQHTGRVGSSVVRETQGHMVGNVIASACVIGQRRLKAGKDQPSSSSRVDELRTPGNSGCTVFQIANALEGLSQAFWHVARGCRHHIASSAKKPLGQAGVD
jgi:hypothetical protein